MILKGNQRAGGQQLAAHLMNSFDNERVELVEVRGATAQDLSGAFAEWAAQARGTRCEKYIYSLSLDPDPKQGRLTREQYLDLMARTERSLKLVGQPRAVVFHEKRGEDGVLREHCHAVWSRIDTDRMKAVQIAHDRLKLRTVAREFARDHGLELPDGMKQGKSKDSRRDRFNNRAKQENLGERQQQERSGDRKEQRMADIATCWRETGNGAAFVQALEAKGYYLARGDQRTYVVIDLHSEVHSLSRQLLGVARMKELKERLAGYPLDKLPDVEAAQAWAKKQREQAEKQREANQKDAAAEAERQKAKAEIEQRRAALKERQQQRRTVLDRGRIDLLARHMSEREGLKAMQEAENTGVAGARLARQPKGLLAFITRITGLKMIADARQRQQDQLRAEQHRRQAQALQGRHDRELKDTDRHYRDLDRREARENRSAETALHREEFQRIAAIVRKPPARELKPAFDRVAHEVYQRTGTDGGRGLQDTTAGRKGGEEQKKERGKLAGLFSTVVSIFRQPEQDLAPPPAAKPEFEKAAKPPVDLVEAFNRQVESRERQEERDRDHDGPDRSFDPKDPKN